MLSGMAVKHFGQLQKNNNMKSASIFWVGSEAVGKTPNYYTNYDGNISNTARVIQVMDWLKLPKNDRPQMITLYFSDTDHEGHSYGTESQQVVDAI